MNREDPNLDLESLNAKFAGADPVEIIRWSFQQFGEGLVMSSSFGAESAVLIHVAIQVKPDIRIIFVDTGYLFAETHRFMRQLRERFSLNILVYCTLEDPRAYLQQAGEENPKWRKDTRSCCKANKNEPFDRAMRELAPKAWMRGVRGDQTSMRGEMQPVEWSPRYNCHAISPLLAMNRHQIFSYLTQHELPYHPLFEKGYMSIGCSPLSCTRPVGNHGIAGT